MKQTIRLTESELKTLIRETLKETELYYDVDNFSGRWTKNPPEDYIDPEGSLDDPNGGDPFGDERSEIVADYGGDEKAAETDYSWRMNDTGNYPGLNDYYRVGKGAVDREVDDALTRHNAEKEWTPRQLRSADRIKGRWINRGVKPEDIDDAFHGSSLDEAITRALKKVLG